MNATARAVEAPALGIDPVYTLRDDLAHAHNPANAHERMLITAVAQAWQRLQQAYELERRLYEKTDILELFSSDLDRFRAVSRHITDCERIWRRAIEELERAKRNRMSAQTASPRPRPRTGTIPSFPSRPIQTAAAQPAQPANHNANHAATAADRASPSTDRATPELVQLS